jgi:hypothetical protein
MDGRGGFMLVDNENLWNFMVSTEFPITSAVGWLSGDRKSGGKWIRNENL